MPSTKPSTEPAEGDPLRRLAAAERAAADGDDHGALTALVQFFEEFRDDAGLQGVRLSSALAAWGELARRYPPAAISLATVRDRAAGRLLAGAVGQDAVTAFAEAAAIDRELDDAAATVRLFRLLDAEAPEQARLVRLFARQALVGQGELELAGRYLADPVAELSVRLEAIDRERVRDAARPPGAFRPPPWAVGHVVERVAEMLTILEGTGRVAEAAQIRELVLVGAPADARDEIRAALGELPL